MAEHLAIDVNVLSGTVLLENSKTVEVEFRNSQGQLVSFTLEPRVMLTPQNQSVTVPFKVKSNKINGLYTGYTIGFPQIVNLSIEWQASARA